MAITATLKHSSTGFSVNSSGPVNYTTSAFTTDNNSLLVVCLDCISDNGGGTPVDFSLSSSPSLTWTRQARAGDNGSGLPPASEIWTAPVTTGASTTITVSTSVSFTFGGDGNADGMSVTSVTEHDTVGNPIGLAATQVLNGSNVGTLSVSLGGTTASTSIVIATVAADGDYGAADIDPGSGWTALHESHSGTNGWFRVTAEYKVGALSTYDFGALNDPYQYSSAGLEIKAASGGGGGISGKLYKITQAVSRASYW